MPSVRFKRTMSGPPAAEVDVYGHSCRFHVSANSTQLWLGLINGCDSAADNIEPYTGRLPDSSSFDAAFFSVHGKEAQWMDPQLRKLLEVSYEAWMDSGISHAALRGSDKVGVYVGSSNWLVNPVWAQDAGDVTGMSPCAGSTLSAFASRLSFFYDFKGPSKTVDTACSSSFVALHDAVVDLQRGRIDYAMVGGASKYLNLSSTAAFNEPRAEGVAVVILKRSDVCGTPWLHHRSPYARILGIATNSDGAKAQGTTFPAGSAMSDLADMVCSANKIKRGEVAYVEADTQELAAVDAVYGSGAGRTSDAPLLVGSIKSRIGHCGACSGLAELIKVCLAYEGGMIPGNSRSALNERKDEGVLKLVTQPTPWKGGLVAICNSGVGGSNVHCVLGGVAGPCWPRSITPPQLVETSETHGQAIKFLPSMPRELIIPVSARTLAGAEKLLRRISAYGKAAEALSVPLKRLANMQAAEVGRLCVRGTICNGSAKWSMLQGTKPMSVCFVFSGRGTQWSGMGAELLETSKAFQESISACARVLKPYNIDLHQEFRGPGGWREPAHAMAGLTALQVGLVDILREEYGVTPAGCLGHTSGEIACGYADGCLSREQAVLIAYHSGRLTPVVGAKDGHSPAMQPLAEELSRELEQIILMPKARSKTWLSTCYPLDCTSIDAGLCGIAYLVQSFMGPLRFPEAATAIPQADSLLLEIGPHAVLQAPLRRMCPSHQYCCTLRKGCNAAETVRECAAELWRKGALLKWALPQETVRKAAELPRDVRDALVSWDHSVEFKLPEFGVQRMCTNSRCVSPGKTIPVAKERAPEEGPTVPETPERADHGWARSNSSASELSDCRSRPQSPCASAADRTGLLLVGEGCLSHQEVRTPPPSPAASANNGPTVRAPPASNFAVHESTLDGGHEVSPLSARQFRALGKPRALPVTADSASSLDFQRLDLVACSSKPTVEPIPSALENDEVPDLSTDLELAPETGLVMKMLLQQAVSVVLLVAIVVTAAANIAQLIAHLSVPARLLWRALLILLVVMSVSALNIISKARLQQGMRLQQPV